MRPLPQWGHLSEAPRPMALPMLRSSRDRILVSMILVLPASPGTVALIWFLRAAPGRGRIAARSLREQFDARGTGHGCGLEQADGYAVSQGEGLATAVTNHGLALF